MSRLFYHAVRTVGRPIIAVASRARILHAERVPTSGPFLLVANHDSIFDAVLLGASTPRMVHWLSDHTIFRRPLGRWFFTGMEARPLHRGQTDPAAVRAVLADLRAGRVVGIFPQGAVREAAELLAQKGRMRATVARLAEVAGVPIVPCVILGGGKFRRWVNWLPLRRTRWTAVYGTPIPLRRELEPAAAREAMLEELARAQLALYAEALPHA